MKTRIFIVASAMLAAMAMSAGAWAQEAEDVPDLAPPERTEAPPPQPDPTNDLKQVLLEMKTDLARQIDALRENMETQISAATATMASRREVAAVESQVDILQQDVQELTALVAETQNALADLKRDYEEAVALLQDDQQAIEELVGAVAGRDSANNPKLNLRGVMQNSPEFRQEMTEAVHGSLRSTGELVFVNKMPMTRYITINNASTIAVPPGETKIVRGVPVGTVTTQVDGGSQKSWSLAPPAYRQSIDIVPASPTVYNSAFRPLVIQ